MVIKRRLLGWKFSTADRLDFQVQIYWIIKRFKKQFASLHCQDKKLFVFPNTPVDQLSLPDRVAVCQNLADFKIKTVKGGFQRRPELIANNNALHFQNFDESWSEVTLLDKFNSRYNKNKRIQRELVEKALCLVNDLDIRRSKDNYYENIRKDEKNTLVLDIGCGDGTSCQPLLDMGYSCVGVDLNLRGLSEFQMSNSRRRKPIQNESAVSQIHTNLQSGNVSFNYSASNSGKQGDNCEHDSSKNPFIVNDSTRYVSPGYVDIIRWDLRYGLPFRTCIFDLAISISFLQWLFYGNKPRQLRLFFSSLKSLLTPQGKAVIQFYPMKPDHLTDAVHYAGEYFQGMVVGDYPHIDRGRKLFLVLFNNGQETETEKQIEKESLMAIGKL